MNKKLKEAIEAVICSTICDSLDTPDLDWRVKHRLHKGILEVIENYLQAYPNTAEPQEVFTARDARSAVCKARTYEGFLKTIMQDIQYQAGYGFSDYSLTIYLDDYKAAYLQRLSQFLISLRYSVVQQSKQIAGRTRIKLTISW